MTIATFARIAHYGDKEPDPRTATCDKHAVASPYSDTARGDGTALANLDWECVVCGIENADLIGTPVIVQGYGASVYVYGGVDEDRSPNIISTRYDMRGGANVVKCTVECVAPADTVIDVKDPRITVEKLAKKRDYQDNGVWLPHMDHPALAHLSISARKTKRDATEYAAQRLAIADYHARRNA